MQYRDVISSTVDYIIYCSTQMIYFISKHSFQCEKIISFDDSIIIASAYNQINPNLVAVTAVNETI